MLDFPLYGISVRYGISLYKGFPFIRNMSVLRIFLCKGFSVTMDLLIYRIFLYKGFYFSFISVHGILSLSLAKLYVKPIVKYYVRDYVRKSILSL